MMKNFDFLKKMQQLQDGIMYDGVIDLDFASIGFSKTDKSEFWNTAITDKLLSDTQISKIEAEFKSLGRTPTIYFENKPKFKLLIDKLVDLGYKKSFEDSWQFWKGGEIDRKHFGNVKKVSSEEELKIFLDTFDECYQKDDPQNPYGKLGDYLKVAEDTWRKNFNVRPFEYFIVYKGEEPVAVATLTSYEGIGYISNVGSLKSVRGQGYGKAATLYCVEQSINRGNTETCLATEEGAYPNEFYKRIGFETRFTAVANSKKL